MKVNIRISPVFVELPYTIIDLTADHYFFQHNLLLLCVGLLDVW